MTENYFVRHALTNVWCTPDQDKQYIFKPKRISGNYGKKFSFESVLRTYELPTKGDWYHVYQIGELTPSVIGILDTVNEWVSIEDHCNAQNMVVDLYTNDGRIFPRFTAFILRNYNDNILIAVKHTSKLANLGVEDLYVRLYSNAFYQKNGDGSVYIKGMLIKSNSDRATMNATLVNYSSKEGYTRIYVNGYLKSNINVLTVSINDFVEIYYDASVREVIDVHLKDCVEFHSDLDKLTKRVVRQGIVNKHLIDYLDDIDFYLINKLDDINYKGVYYHKNNGNSVRMITHQDYSLVVSYINNYILKEGWPNIESVVVKMFIRKSGYNRPLTYENSKIHEFYKLNQLDQTKALSGVDSSLDLWQARYLEKTLYCRMMGYGMTDITSDVVKKAYGYDACASVFANTPIKAFSNIISLPYGLYENSTVYEFDENGLLIESYNHLFGYDYPIRNPSCKMVEAVIGKGSYTLSTAYQAQQYRLNDAYNYRFYKCRIVDGEADYNWVDVTGSQDYSVVNGIVQWKVEPELYYTAIRSDKDFLAYSLLFDYRDAIYRFTLNCIERKVDGELHEGPCNLPFGQIDVYLNGYKLIKDLDYFVNWPEIWVVNKSYLNKDSFDQKLTIRAIGFVNQDMSFEQKDEYGFVIHGRLSKNNIFDIRDDRVISISIDGKTYTREDLDFTEDVGTVSMPSVRNGAPYQILHPWISLKGLINKDIISFRKEARVLSKKVSNYLSLKIDEPTDLYPNPVQRYHHLYSPFINKIIYDLKYNLIDISLFTGRYSDLELTHLLKDYEYLLKYEPTFKDINFDYVTVHAHNLVSTLSLPPVAYNLVARAIRIYLKDKIDITRFITMELGG